MTRTFLHRIPFQLSFPLTNPKVNFHLRPYDQLICLLRRAKVIVFSVGTSAPAARNARHRSAVQPAAPSSRGASANARPPRNAPTRSTRPVVACRGASAAPVRTARPPAVPTTRNVASRAVSQLSAATARVQHHPPKPTLAAAKTAHYMSEQLNS